MAEWIFKYGLQASGSADFLRRVGGMRVAQPQAGRLSAFAKRLAQAMETAFGAVGANIFQNNGIQAGQHVPHLHIHVVPRYPTSDPEKLFLQRNFPILPMAELDAVAAALRDALPAPWNAPAGC